MNDYISVSTCREKNGRHFYKFAPPDNCMPNLNSSSNICCKIIENCEFILGATPTYVGPDDDGEPNWTNDFPKFIKDS